MAKTHDNKKRKQKIRSLDTIKTKTKTRKVKCENKTTEPTNKPTVKLKHEQIAERAFIIWQNHGCKSFEDEWNWNEAEKQLREELSIV
jgi:hypothetical protein